MNRFGVSDLSDREILQLIEECGDEIDRRSASLNANAAVSGRYLSAVERAKASHKALEYQKQQLQNAAIAEAERVSIEALRAAESERSALRAAEAERIRWATRKGIALAAQSVFDPDQSLQITVWVGPDGEKRIYVDHGYGGVKLATYYATGNRKNPPGTLETSKRRDERLAFCKALSAAYGAMKLNVETAAKWDGEAIPIPGYNPPEEEH